MTSHTTGSSAAPARNSRGGRIFAWVLIIVVVVVIISCGWVGVRGILAYTHLSDAQDSARAAADNLDDPAAALAVAPAISDDTAAAHALTSDPVWKAFEVLPWVGPQMQAVATVASALDDVTANALIPLAESAQDFSVDSLRPIDGRFDVASIAELADTATTSSDAVTHAAAAVTAIDGSVLLAPLREPVQQVADLLSTAEASLDALTRATALMPAMLGAEGPRDYLIVFQNNAEWRSLGGIVGAMAVVHTDDGGLSLGAQASSSDFDRFEESVLPLSDELLDIYADKPGIYIQNVTQIPDFAVAGPLAQEMWARQSGQVVNGVIALDPVSLSYLLEATGPITLPTGDVLSSDNAVSLLLNEVYQRYEIPAEQDAFFAAAAASVFAALSSGDVDPTALISALARAGEERRLLIWNDDPLEQSILNGTTLQGALPVTDAETTAFGVYVNDGTGSKMDYYMGLDTAVQWCSDTEGSPDATLKVQLTNNAPADAATLPSYITGGGNFGVDAGITRTVAYLYLPEGAEVVASESSTGFGGGTHDGRRVLTWSTELAPGESATASVRASTPLTPELVAQQTPTINTPDTLPVAITCSPLG